MKPRTEEQSSVEREFGLPQGSLQEAVAAEQAKVCDVLDLGEFIFLNTVYSILAERFTNSACPQVKG